MARPFERAGPAGPAPASLAVREARAGDAPFLAWAIQESGRSHLDRGTWDFVLPGPEAERLDLLARLVASDAVSFCHYSGFLVGEWRGEPAAAMCGYQPAVATAPLFLEAVGQAFGGAGWSRARIREMLARFAPIMTCAPDPPDDAWVVEWVATAPQQRGRGHARALLEALLERGRARDLGLAHLGLLIGNAAAQAVYERAGFRVVDERRHPDFEAAIGAPGLRLMERLL